MRKVRRRKGTAEQARATGVAGASRPLSTITRPLLALRGKQPQGLISDKPYLSSLSRTRALDEQEIELIANKGTAVGISFRPL